MKTLIVLFMTLLLFSGCTQKEPRTITKPEIICVKQTIYPYGNKIKIRNHPDDTALIQARSQYLKQGFVHYEDQVLRNNNLCKDKNQNPKKEK